MNPENRMVDIEVKIARLEDVTETLNGMVYRQQKKIDELEALCAALARRLQQTQADQADAPLNERPPHY